MYTNDHERKKNPGCLTPLKKKKDTTGCQHGKIQQYVFISAALTTPAQSNNKLLKSAHDGSSGLPAAHWRWIRKELCTDAAYNRADFYAQNVGPFD